MKNILFIGLLLLSMSACSSFLEEYSQDLARVENITDLDELLLGSAYLPAGKISSTSSGGSSMLSTLIMFSVIQGLYILRKDEDDSFEDEEYYEEPQNYRQY